MALLRPGTGTEAPAAPGAEAPTARSNHRSTPAADPPHRPKASRVGAPGRPGVLRVGDPAGSARPGAGRWRGRRAPPDPWGMPKARNPFGFRAFGFSSGDRI
ncbi:hypothetical protein GCM10010245_62430 [Streptomyces spectabilis]|nr:hypothetical protein GCM10010245_62430 [Streptomyces spectabilis]